MTSNVDALTFLSLSLSLSYTLEVLLLPLRQSFVFMFRLQNSILMMDRCALSCQQAEGIIENPGIMSESEPGSESEECVNSISINVTWVCAVYLLVWCSAYIPWQPPACPVGNRCVCGRDWLDNGGGTHGTHGSNACHFLLRNTLWTSTDVPVCK